MYMEDVISYGINKKENTNILVKLAKARELNSWKDNHVYEEVELYGIMCTHVDDLCFRGTEMFHKQVISRIKEKLKVGAEEKRQTLMGRH